MKRKEHLIMDILEKNIQLFLQSGRNYCESIDIEQEKYTQIEQIISDGSMRFFVNLQKELDYAEADLSDKNTLYIYVGLSCVPALVHMYARMTEGSRMIIIEKNSSIFVEALRDDRISPLITSERVQFIIADTEQILSVMHRALLSPIIFLSANTVIHFEDYYYYFEKRWVKQFGSDVLAMIKSLVISVGNDIDDTLIGIKNIIRNTGNILQSTPPSQIFQKQLYQGKPAIIVAAGPSLHKQLPLLKKMQGKALIFCVDTALKVLLTEGIIPDAVTTAERIPRVYEWFYKDIPLQEKTVFIGLPFVDQRIFDKFQYKVISYRKRESICNWVGEIYDAEALMEIGLSCAHVGFSFAHALGCSPIVLIGQDLAYAQDGSGHTSGTSYEEHKEFIKQADEQRALKVRGYYGDEVYTDEMWNQFRVWYERSIHLIDTKVYNCTEGGAYIQGAIHTPFSVVCQELSGMEVPSLAEVCEQVGVIQQADEKKKRIIDSLEDKRLNMKSIESLATEAVVRLDKILIDQQERTEQYTDQELENIIEVMHQCDKNYQEMRSKQWFMHFFQGHLSRLFYEMSRVTPEFCQESVLENVRIQHRFYYFVHTATQAIIGVFQECMDELTNKI